VLARSITLESFEPVARRHAQIRKQMSCVQKMQLAASNFDQVGGKTLAKDAIKDVFRERILEAPNHDVMYQYMIHQSIALYHRLIRVTCGKLAVPMLRWCPADKSVVDPVPNCRRSRRKTRARKIRFLEQIQSDFGRPDRLEKNIPLAPSGKSTL
jgi:hypothetical protein